MHNQTPTASRACPLCGGDNGTVIINIRADQIIQSSPYYNHASYTHLGVKPDSQYGISQCQDCTFAFASQVPSEHFLEKLYAGTSDTKDAVEVFARPERAAYAFDALSRLLTAMSNNASKNHQGVIPHHLKILDVGCAFGVGSLGLAQRYYPYEITGVEWSQPTRDYLSAQGMTVYRALEDIPEESPFDGILLNDVLEHVPDPIAFVKKLSNLSHGGTVIWVNVPNFIDWRLSETTKQVATGSMEIPTDMNPWEHLSYFSPKTLNTVMSMGNFASVPESPVKYPIKCETRIGFNKALIRAIRDIWRIYQNKYPQEIHTAAIFSKLGSE